MCATLKRSGRGAAWLARLLGVQEVPGSNPGGPTNNFKSYRPRSTPTSPLESVWWRFGVHFASPSPAIPHGHCGHSTRDFRFRSARRNFRFLYMSIMVAADLFGSDHSLSGFVREFSQRAPQGARGSRATPATSRSDGKRRFLLEHSRRLAEVRHLRDPLS